MQDIEIHTESKKRGESSLTCGILSIVFSIITVATEAFGLVEKIIEFFFGPIFGIIALLILESPISVKLIPFLGTYLGSFVFPIIHFFITLVGAVAEFIPFIFAVAAIVLGVIAIIIGLSKKNRSSLTMGLISLAASVISSAVCLIPTLLALGGKLLILLFYIFLIGSNILANLYIILF